LPRERSTLSSPEWVAGRFLSRQTDSCEYADGWAISRADAEPYVRRDESRRLGMKRRKAGGDRKPS
jgi:hypothetical protein